MKYIDQFADREEWLNDFEREQKSEEMKLAINIDVIEENDE